MGQFTQVMDVTLNGETFRVRSRPRDWTNAEIQLASAGGDIAKSPVQMKFRIAYCAFRRLYPDHELGKSYGVFFDALDDVLDLELDGDGALDPTPSVDSDD